MQVHTRPADADEDRLRLLLRAILAEGVPEGAPEHRGPDSWTLMAGRLEDLDALSTFERTALPLLVGRWQAEGRDLTALPIPRGLRRRMVVRNRIVLDGARAALERLNAAGIDAMPLKSAALVGRVLPERGLRDLADVDLWVRPSAHAAAVRLLARPGPGSTGLLNTVLRSTGAAPPSLHARMVRDAAGCELDLHRFPSHLFARRGCSPTDAERRFDRTWDRCVEGRAPLADILYLTLVNTLFSHAPGESRAAFALIELDMALRHPDVSDATLHALTAHVVEDRTAAILVEHLDRLGPGVSTPLDRLLHDHLEDVLTPGDRALRTWMAVQPRQSGTGPAFRAWLRQAAHTRQRVPLRTWTVARWLLRTEAQNLRLEPWVPITRLLRPRTWQRVGRLAWGLLRTRNSR